MSARLFAMSEIFQTAIVEKRNVLNELRSNNMTLQELRFFSIYLSKIDPFNVSTRCVRFPIEDFQRIMGFGRLNLGQLRASTDSLLCKLVHVPDEDGRGMRTFQLFKECHLFKANDGKWYMEIDAHDKALPLMFEFKNRYFTYELWNALRLRSPNQVRMYEILKQYERIGKRELPVTELRELLGIAPNEYTLWQNFKVRVLDSCQQALKETTDICFTYERGKVGRGGKWLTVVFDIQKNNDYIDQLTLEEFIAEQPSSDLLEANANEENTKEMDEDFLMLQKYGSDPLCFFAESMQYEFTMEETRVLFDIVLSHYIDPDNSAIARYDFMQRLYHQLLERAADPTLPQLKNRYKYLKAMLLGELEE